MDLADLKRLLVNAFNDAELRQFVRLGPDGERIEAALPMVTSRDALAYEAALAWSRYGLLELLRDHLLAERPHRKAEVLALWGELEVIEPPRTRPDGIHVAIELPLDSQILNEVENHQLGMYLGQLAATTAPGTNIDLRVTKLFELTSSVVATVEVVIFGDFTDERVAEIMLNKFHDKPWALPAADKVSFDNDEQRLCLTAYAKVSTDHLYPD